MKCDRCENPGEKYVAWFRLPSFLPMYEETGTKLRRCKIFRCEVCATRLNLKLWKKQPVINP